MSIGSFLRKAADAVDDIGGKAKGAFETVRDVANDPAKREALGAELDKLGDKAKTAVLGAIVVGADAVSAAAKDPDGTIQELNAKATKVVTKVGDKIDEIVRSTRPPGGDGPAAP